MSLSRRYGRTITPEGESVQQPRLGVSCNDVVIHVDERGAVCELFDLCGTGRRPPMTSRPTSTRGGSSWPITSAGREAPPYHADLPGLSTRELDDEEGLWPSSTGKARGWWAPSRSPKRPASGSGWVRSGGQGALTTFADAAILVHRGLAHKLQATARDGDLFRIEPPFPAPDTDF